MSKYSPEERAEIMARAREALADAEGAEMTLAAPRPETAAWPPCETRSQRWRREAAEEEQRFAAERAASQPLTEYQAANLEHQLTARFGSEIGAKRFLYAASP